MTEYFRSKEFTSLVSGEECTLNLPGCVGGPCVGAHSNFSKHGKGKSIKAHDCFICIACDPCHRELDQGKKYSLAEKEALWERAFVKSLPILMLKAFNSAARKPKRQDTGGTALTSSKIVPRRT